MAMNQKNKGFTLVEVLIAMTILAIIVVPLLRAFVTSANVNAKAEHLMNANNIAQNIIEELKAEGIEGVEEMGYELDASPKPEYDGTGKKCYIQVNDTAVSAGSADYDVEVILSANENGTKDFASMNSMNEPDCGYYAQPEHLDQQAAEEFQMRNAAYTYEATAKLDSAGFMAIMNRDILVDISSNIVEVTYNYSIPYSEGAGGTRYTEKNEAAYQETTTIFDNRISEEELEAVYIYYYPLYTKGNNTIQIIKPENLKVDIYLVEMKLDEAAADGRRWWPTIRSFKEDGQTPIKTELCSNLVRENCNLEPADIKIKSLGNEKETIALYDVEIKVYRYQEDRAVAFVDRFLVGTYTGSFLVNH